MRIGTIIVSRSKACHVKTLHTILKLNLKCVQKQFANEIIFVNDDPYAKADAISKALKTYDRIFFIDFGIHVDEGSLDQLFEKHEGVNALVFPAPVEGVDWDMFKRKVREGVDEPIEQMGLHFDTELGSKFAGDVYHVQKTNPKCFMLNCKTVKKKLDGTKLTSAATMFQKLIDSNIKIHAYTKARLIATYTHECISNILNAAGVKAT